MIEAGRILRGDLEDTPRPNPEVVLISPDRGIEVTYHEPDLHRLGEGGLAGRHGVLLVIGHGFVCLSHMLGILNPGSAACARDSGRFPTSCRKGTLRASPILPHAGVTPPRTPRGAARINRSSVVASMEKRTPGRCVMLNKIQVDWVCLNKGARR